MVQQLRVRRPRTVLRTAANFPGQLNLPGARALSDTLNSVVDTLPGITSLPSPVNLGQAPGIPSPRVLVSNMEQSLPSGLPRLSNFLPDVQFDGTPAPGGTTTEINGTYRKVEATAPRTVRPGGYRPFGS